MSFKAEKLRIEIAIVETVNEGCPCGEQSRRNCAYCQELPEWYFDKPKTNGEWF